MTQLTTGSALKDLDIDTEENPRSLINIVPNHIKAKFLAAREKRPELFQLDEDELLKTLRDENKAPTATVNRIRMNLWSEYDKAQTLNRKMSHAAMFAGVCARQVLEFVMKKPEKVAWLFCPPADYATSLHEALLFGLAELRRALSLPHVQGKKVDTRLLEVKVKIYEKIEARALGAIPQKIMNLHANVPEEKQVPGATEYEKIRERIKLLESRDRMKEGGEDAGTKKSEEN